MAMEYPEESDNGPPDADNGDIHQPHDKLFAAAFGDPENAAGLLRAELPAALADAIDWDSLELQSGSFIDPHFRSVEADLLFSAKIQERETFLYVLFEHQSTKDPRLPLRLLRYILRAWDRLESRFPPPGKLPPILPVVLSQNAEIWDVPTRLAELLDIPEELEDEFRPFLPDFGYRHLQLAEMDYKDIPGTSAGIFVLRAMKAERLGELLENSVWEEELAIQVPQDLFLMVLRYILDADVDKEAFVTKLEELQEPEIRSKAMTLAQQFRQEGRQEGRQEYILEALELRFGNLPEGLREAVRSVSGDAALQSLHRAAIRCATLEEFSESL